jgi:hypothetical protein
MELARIARQGSRRNATGLEVLAHAALSVAAQRKFPRYANADVIGYIAAIRSARSQDGTGDDIDPQAAETLLRRALGQDIPVPGDVKTRIHTTFTLLALIASDLRLDPAGVEALLAEARSLADRWTSST